MSPAGGLRPPRRVHAPSAQLQVLPAGAEVGLGRRLLTAGQRLAPPLLALRTGGPLLGEQPRLDAVEHALQPADQLSLGDPQLGLGRRLALAERQRDPLEFLTELRGEALLELTDGRGVDVPQPVAAGHVERRGPHLLQQLLDHRADPHDLGRLLDHAADAHAAVVPVVGPHRHGHGADRAPVGPDDDDLLRALAAVVRCSHVSILPRARTEPFGDHPRADGWTDRCRTGRVRRKGLRVTRRSMVAVGPGCRTVSPDRTTIATIASLPEPSAY